MNSVIRVPFVGMPDDVRAFMRGHKDCLLVKLHCFPDSSIISEIEVHMNHEQVQAFVDDWARNYKPQ